MSGVVTYLPKFLGGKRLPGLKEAPYVYVDDDDPTEAVDLSLPEWTRRCQLAAADVEIERAGLIEAENQLVQCQARLAKAELFLERQQKGFLDAAAKIPGVPCPR